MRKPVHFAVSNIGGGACLYSAVCDDGSMWLCTSTTEWERIPDIPQDEPEQPATSPDVVKALRELAKAEWEYRNRYTYADYSGYTKFLILDKMRRAGDAARAVLKRIDEQEGPLYAVSECPWGDWE